jgi:hypothetical protein
VTADDRLSGEELAAQTGSSPAVIGELAAAGILRSGPDGLYGNGDMQRVLVASALVDAGLSVELMRRGIEAGVVSFEDTDVIYASPGRLSLSASELAAEVGLGTETVLRIITALGISRPDPETPPHRGARRRGGSCLCHPAGGHRRRGRAEA